MNTEHEHTREGDIALMTEKPKCSWCGDRIHCGQINIGSDKYHKKCLPLSLVSFEMVEIKSAVKLLELDGADVSKVQEKLEDLTETLLNIE